MRDAVTVILFIVIGLLAAGLVFLFYKYKKWKDWQIKQWIR